MSDRLSLLSRLEPYRRQAEEHLAANLESDVPAILDIGRYVMLSGGKRMRPILYLVSLGLCGDSDPVHAAYSSIFEFMHGASLLHDDVIDEAETRRGRRAAHHNWGNRRAILAGDHLFGQAFDLSADTGQIEFVRTLARCTAALAAGQVLESEYQHRLETGYPTYLEIITAKTAVLLAASTKTAAIIAGAEPEQIEALEGYGLDIGVAFQIVDDILDWAGEEAVVGKPVGIDLREGKATLPWIRALEKADSELKAEMLARAEGEISDDDFAWLKEQVISLGGVDQALAEAEALKESAQARLSGFPDGPERQLLLDIADYICRRRL